MNQNVGNGFEWIRTGLEEKKYLLDVITAKVRMRSKYYDCGKEDYLKRDSR